MSKVIREITIKASVLISDENEILPIKYHVFCKDKKHSLYSTDFETISLQESLAAFINRLN